MIRPALLFCLLVAASPSAQSPAIAAGDAHSLATDRSGQVWGGFGSNLDGQLGTGRRERAQSPMRISLPAGVSAVAAGQDCSFVADDQGQLWAFGANECGQLGLGDQQDRDVPTAVPGMGRIIAVDAGFLFSLAVDVNGGVWGFGAKGAGQLGVGDTSDRLVPTRITSLTVATWIRAGVGHHALLGDAGGRPHGHGADSSGQLNTGHLEFNSEPTPILPKTRPTPSTDCPGSNGRTTHFVDSSRPAIGGALVVQTYGRSTASTFVVPVLSSRGYLRVPLDAVGAPGYVLNVRPEIVFPRVSLPGNGTGSCVHSVSDTE